MKLWAGRAGGDVDERLSAINNSIGFDSRMFRQDITGSIAHARMLGKVGVIEKEEAERIIKEGIGTQFDPHLGGLFIAILNEEKGREKDRTEMPSGD